MTNVNICGSVLYEVIYAFFPPLMLYFHEMQPKNGSFTPVGPWDLKARLPLSASIPTGKTISAWQLPRRGPWKAFRSGRLWRAAPTGTGVANVSVHLKKTSRAFILLHTLKFDELLRASNLCFPVSDSLAVFCISPNTPAILFSNLASNCALL